MAGRGHDEIQGRGGDDVICGEGGVDHINGGEGADWIDGGTSRDYLDGGLGTDHVQGKEGKDQFAQIVGPDVIVGGLGNDKFAIGGEAEGARVLGGAGRDDFKSTYQGTGASLRGGADSDVLRTGPPFAEDGDIMLTIDYRVGQITSDFNDWVVSVRGFEVTKVYGSPGLRTHAVFHGTPDDDRVGLHLDAWKLTAFGYAGDDVFYGSGGDDNFNGGPGTDAAYGTKGRAVCASIEKGTAC